MSNLALDNIRKNVAYQNTVDIWIAMCQEHGADWMHTETSQNFIASLLTTILATQQFPLFIKLPR